MVEPQEDRHRDLQRGRHVDVLGPRTLDRGQARHQRRPEPRPPVAVPQPPDLDVCSRPEPHEGMALPRGRAARQVEIEPPEGQEALARGDDDVGAVLRRQPLGQRAVVELGGEARPRIEGIGRGPAPRKEERVGVDRRREVVGRARRSAPRGGRRAPRARTAGSRPPPCAGSRGARRGRRRARSLNRSRRLKRWSTWSEKPLGTPAESALAVTCRWKSWGGTGSTPTGVAHAPASSVPASSTASRDAGPGRRAPGRGRIIRRTVPARGVSVRPRCPSAGRRPPASRRSCRTSRPCRPCRPDTSRSSNPAARRTASGGSRTRAIGPRRPW